MHWGLLWILYHVSWLPLKQFSKRTPYTARIMHVLSNTFIIVQFDEKEETSKTDLEVCLEQEKEEAKGSEVVILLLLTGLELAGGTTCGRTSSQFLEFQKQLLLQSERLGHLPNSNLLVGDQLPLHASRLSVHTWSRSLSKKLNNFHFENDCRDSCHSIHNHGWRQQCTTSKQPERSDIVIPKDHKTTRDYHAHDGSLPDRSELIPAQRQDTISYSSSSFFQVSIGYATMRWPLKMFSKTRTLYLMSFKSCQTHHSWSESN